MDELYTLANLKFGSYLENLSRLAFEEQNFSDVTLLTADLKKIKAHKLILTSQSSFFTEVFQVITETNPTLYLGNVKSNQLQRILKFIYHGECQVPQDQVNSFIRVGQELKIDSILQENEQKEMYFTEENFTIPDQPQANSESSKFSPMQPKQNLFSNDIHDVVKRKVT